MSTRSLPSRPNLDQLKRQARELQHARREPTLADAQRTLAREYGFRSWAELKQRVEIECNIARITPHPRFAEALAALDAGDVERLRGLLSADPSFVHARTNLDPPYGYFTGATLLHHVAGNPGRDMHLPANVIDIARVLLDAGADVGARTLGPTGWDTMGLLITSKQASDMGVSGPLMTLLLERGARLDVTREDALDLSLANHAPRAAEKMIELGATADPFAAAALGRMDLLHTFFDEAGKLLVRPRRGGKEMSERDAIGLALLYAYVRHQTDAVEFLLEKDGNWDMLGVNNGTALHRAAWAGDLPMVELLVAKGADPNNRDNPFHGTPMGWAAHNEQTHVVEWLQKNVAVDLRDAVAFDLLDHVRARLRDHPQSVDRIIDGATSLHVAARLNRVEAAKLLLANGADPDRTTDDGLTTLDVAEAHGSIAVARLLEQHGATRSAAAAGLSADPRLKSFERAAADILEAYSSATSEAIARLEGFFKRRVTLHGIRNGVQRRLEKARDAQISLGGARDVVAGLRGFRNWASLVVSVTRPDDKASSWNVPLYRIDERRNSIQVRHVLDDADWEAILAVVAEQKIEALDASGQMTDQVIERLAAFDHIVRLGLSGSKNLTDAGMRQLARFPRLQHLDLSGCGFTDQGLGVLRDLRDLRTFQLYWHAGVSDAGLATLASCNRLERVELLGTPVGDGTIEALTGKTSLRFMKTGTRVTDASLPRLHAFPVFKSWRGGAVKYSLMSPEAEPNHLLLDGPFTSKGIATLAGLDGLFGLSFFRHTSALTPDALKTLAALPNLGFVGCDGSICDDEAMVHLAAIPRLRMLMAQGTVATDAGFAALSRSHTLEYLWGRECSNLTGRGFAALRSLPALRGLAVSCKGVDDAALATLPRFPALRELMPMEVTDDGFRHIGRCENLEALWCMYCRDTTDIATEHIANLPNLKTYYAGQTKITDRSLATLSRMASLERLEFWNCAGITNAGAALLAALPELRDVSFDMCRHITPEAETLFPARVRARVS